VGTLFPHWGGDFSAVAANCQVLGVGVVADVAFHGDSFCQFVEGFRVWVSVSQPNMQHVSAVQEWEELLFDVHPIKQAHLSTYIEVSSVTVIDGNILLSVSKQNLGLAIFICD